VYVDVGTDFYVLFVKIPLEKMTAKEAKQTEQEASLLARLDHPNIVAFWESFVSGSNLYIVMEFANGKAPWKVLS
jgi:serine/threonine protein kinase